MTRRPALPTHHEVHRAVEELTQTAGKPPTVLALARHLGLANTTFHRNFPDLVHEPNPPRPPTTTTWPMRAATRLEQLEHNNAALPRDKRELTEHLDLAAAAIQRLTLENHRLRQQLETASKITRINPRQPDNNRAGARR